MCVLPLHEITLDALAFRVHKMEHGWALAFTRAATSPALLQALCSYNQVQFALGITG